MEETRKIAAILVADIVGYSRLASADEDRTLARLRALRSDLIDPTISVHHGRIVKRSGDGLIAEFRSVVDAVRCAIEVQHPRYDRRRNAGLSRGTSASTSASASISGDVVEEADGDLMGDGISHRRAIEGDRYAWRDLPLRESAYRQSERAARSGGHAISARLQLKNIAEPIRVYSLGSRQSQRQTKPR